MSEKQIQSCVIHHGDCLQVLKTLKDNSVDSIVTDPPAGISFMGKTWDDDKGGRKQWTAWMESVAIECLRVIKPGGHALVWSIGRTSHWTGWAWESAGWEPRDMIVHITGQGMPKSQNIGKMLDKKAGATREVVGLSPYASRANKVPRALEPGGGHRMSVDTRILTAPATDEAKQWEGWGTGLKPSTEIWMCFKKLENPPEATNAMEVVCHLKKGLLSLGANLVGLNSTPFQAGLQGGNPNFVPKSAEIPSVGDPEKGTHFGKEGDSPEGMDTSALELAITMSLSTVSSWQNILEECFKLKSMCITETEIDPITDWKILNYYLSQITPSSMLQKVTHPGGCRAYVSIVESLLNEMLIGYRSIPTHSVQGSVTIQMNSNPESLSLLQRDEKELQKELSSQNNTWLLLRKPLSENTIVANVLTHGTGALNIDGCRIQPGTNEPDSGAMYYRNRGLPMPENRNNYFGGEDRVTKCQPIAGGRWPANVTLEHHEDCKPVGTRKVKTGTAYEPKDKKHVNRVYSGGWDSMGREVTFGDSEGNETVIAWECVEGCPVKELDLQSGDLAPGSWVKTEGARPFNNDGKPTGGKQWQPSLDNGGGASRFFFTAKASKSEKTAGGKVENKHPTVKPVKFMRYLVRLITPPGGLVLDPFTGSGTTGVATLQEGFMFLGIELEEASLVTARQRCALALDNSLWDDPLDPKTEGASPEEGATINTIEGLLDI